MGFQVGNQIAKKSKLFETMLKAELNQLGDNHKALRTIVGKLISQACAGEQWAIKEVADRLDGKMAQAIHHGQDEDADATRIAYDDRDIVRRLAFMMLAPPEKVSDI